MKKVIIPIIFALVGTSFVTYSFLDTFIIPKKAQKVTYNNNSLDIPLGPVLPSSSSSSNPTSSQSNFSSEVVNNDQQGQYYENLTVEQIAAKFTPEKVFVERRHYSDPDIYIDISENRDAEDLTTYYVADIRIRNLGYFRTALANDTFAMRNSPKERTSDICNRKKGILAINGDTYGSQEGGYVIRNGNLLEGQYRSTKNLKRSKSEKADDLIIKKDGTFEIIDEHVTSFEEVVAKNPLHVFSFGPALVKQNVVSVGENEEVGTALSGNRNQRCAIGIISPGHYCFVVSNGRMQESHGLSLYSLANIMKDLHCETAYNFDGGGSATMYLEDGTGNATGLGHLVNYPHQDYSGSMPSNPRMQQREVSDIVYIGKEQ